VKNFEKRTGGVYPPVFFKECARDLFCVVCGGVVFESVEVIDSAGVAAVREIRFEWREWGGGVVRSDVEGDQHAA
jgi:hypothetical protein